MEIQGDSLDDILHGVFAKLVKTNKIIFPSKGKAREIIGTHLLLKNPRARFSRTESRATLFTCLGELLWYLSGRNDLEFIRHYIRRYAEFSDDGVTLFGAYGPRIFGDLTTSHWRNVATLLRERPDSRQAVIPIYQPSDVTAVTKDLPCTCTIQFFRRETLLHMQVHMRSNDVYLGLPHDIFAFTMMQEIMATELGCGLGEYHHSVGSLHLYDSDREKAQMFLNEGWQSTMPMPPMPIGDQSPAITWLINTDGHIRANRISSIDWTLVAPYWQDIGRLLIIHDLLYRRDMRGVIGQSKLLSTNVYESFLRRRVEVAGKNSAQGRLEL